MNILIFGSNGLVGSSLVRNLSVSKKNYNLICSTRKDTNLFSLSETSEKINKSDPNIVIIAAAKVGGIYANSTQRFNFIIENLKISMNIFESLVDFTNTKIINIGSSCIYPLGAQNPITEDSLMTGKLEPTNSPYSMAKLSSLEISKTMSEQFGHKMQSYADKLEGPNEEFEELNSHVIPGLIYKMHKAKQNNLRDEIWEVETSREFMHVDDLSSAIEFLIDKDTENDYQMLVVMKQYQLKIWQSQIKIVKFDGSLIFNKEYPDGNPKTLDSSRLNSLGWNSSITLETGIENTYNVENIN